MSTTLLHEGACDLLVFVIPSKWDHAFGLIGRLEVASEDVTRGGRGVVGKRKSADPLTTRSLSIAYFNRRRGCVGR